MTRKRLLFNGYRAMLLCQEELYDLADMWLIDSLKSLVLSKFMKSYVSGNSR